MNYDHNIMVNGHHTLVNCHNTYHTDVPSLADEIAEPRPDTNIIVAAFTVSEKSSNTI